LNRLFLSGVIGVSHSGRQTCAADVALFERILDKENSLDTILIECSEKSVRVLRDEISLSRLFRRELEGHQGRPLFDIHRSDPH
jgi:hypothetical protein